MLVLMRLGYLLDRQLQIESDFKLQKYYPNYTS